MRITELLTKDTIAMDLSASDKNGVIDELVNQLDKAKENLVMLLHLKRLFITVNHKVQRELVKVLRFLTQKLQL